MRVLVDTKMDRLFASERGSEENGHVRWKTKVELNFEFPLTT